MSFSIRRIVRVKKTRDDAILPSVSEGNVGFDLYLPSKSMKTYLKPGRVTRIDIGLAFATDMSYSMASAPSSTDGKATPIVPFFKVEGRSGLASKGIFPVGGIIDPSYRGEIGILIFNLTENDYVFLPGERIAQLVCYHTLAPLGSSEVVFEEVDWVEKSDRNDNGFGSSGA